MHRVETRVRELDRGTGSQEEGMERRRERQRWTEGWKGKESNEEVDRGWRAKGRKKKEAEILTEGWRAKQKNRDVKLDRGMEERDKVGKLERETESGRERCTDPD